MALKFGTSGVRGPVEELTDRECALFTAAFVDYLKRHSQVGRIVLGGDFRSSTPRILAAVAYAIQEADLEVIYGGFVPTPALMYYAMMHDCASIMVTGSHIPDDRNGIKFNLPWGEVLKSDEPHISGRYRELKEMAVADDPAFDDTGMLRTSHRPRLGEANETIVREYVQRYLSWFPDQALLGQKIVVYEHSTVGRELLGELVERLGAQVVRVGRTDHFVPVDTEAIDQPERLAAWVKEHGADALISMDGDADRPLVVDEQGAVIRGDVLGILVAAAIGAEAVVVPVSCNTALERSGRFKKCWRTRIGSPYVIEGMQEALGEGFAPVVGYEANGGFLLATAISGLHSGETLLPLPTRDAVLPILAMLVMAREISQPLSALVAGLPSRFTVSGLLRKVPSATGNRLVKELERNGPVLAAQLLEPKLGKVRKWDFTDGARMTLHDDRVLHLRPSGNAPEFRIYTEANSEDEAQTLNDAAAEIVRDLIDRAEEEDGRLGGYFLSHHEERLATIDRMNLCPDRNEGMDIVIVSTASAADERFWQARLEATRGQIVNRDALVIAVHEDWPGGAGNGLGTLYALRLARQKARTLHDVDLIEALRGGAAVAIYHTAGKGTRMAPLPAVEANNKPAIKLPSLVRIGHDLAPVTVLESVIKQTGIYARSRKGRLSVVWGDQIFIPSTSCDYKPRHHIDIIGQLGPMPDAEEWEARGLQRYGLLAVDAQGNAAQVEKVSHAEAVRLVEKGALSVEGGIGVSLGSFSLSTSCTLALLDEFSPELEARTVKLDTDPHFWMPMTLDLQTYRDMRGETDRDTLNVEAHHARMARLAQRLCEADPDLQLFGVVDMGSDSYWWDYGQLRLYMNNLRLMTQETPEGEAVRRFFKAETRRRDSVLGDELQVDDASCVLGCSVGSGYVRNSILVNVQAEHVEVQDCLLIQVQAPDIHGEDALFYWILDDGTVKLKKGAVRVDVPLADERLTMLTSLDRDGGDDWYEQLPGNPYSYNDLYSRVEQSLAKEGA